MSYHDTFRVAALQVPTVHADAKATLEWVDKALEALYPGTDLVALPELFTTGFIDDPTLARSVAEPADGYTMKYVLYLAAKHNCALSGSYLAIEGDMLYNRAFIVESGGDITIYDKHHLFTLSDESRIITAGQHLPPVVRFRGLNIAIAVCYDIRFPVWCRNNGARYDMLVVPANWPAKRSFAWEHLLQARAIENQSYVIGANRAGEDAFGKYDGQTYIFDYTGHRIDTCDDDAAIRYATISRRDLYKYREAFPFLADADHYKLL